MQDDYYYTIRVNDVRIDDHSFLGVETGSDGDS